MKYILGVVGLIFFGILAIVLIVNRTPSSPAQRGVTVVKLADYANKDSSVSYTVRGNIVGEEAFRSIRITVDRNQRVMDILAGYNNNVQSSSAFPNNSAAYSTFMQALDKLGFTRTRTTTVKDETGFCPLGLLYTYNLNVEGSQKTHLWSSSCASGSFGGDNSQIQALFQLQIPGYVQLTGNVNL